MLQSLRGGFPANSLALHSLCICDFPFFSIDRIATKEQIRSGLKGTFDPVPGAFGGSDQMLPPFPGPLEISAGMLSCRA